MSISKHIETYIQNELEQIFEKDNNIFSIDFSIIKSSCLKNKFEKCDSQLKNDFKVFLEKLDIMIFDNNNKMLFDRDRARDRDKVLSLSDLQTEESNSIRVISNFDISNNPYCNIPYLGIFKKDIEISPFISILEQIRKNEIKKIATYFFNLLELCNIILSSSNNLSEEKERNKQLLLNLFIILTKNVNKLNENLNNTIKEFYNANPSQSYLNKFKFLRKDVKNSILL